MIARSVFLLLVLMVPLELESQPVDIKLERAALVKSIHNALFLIVKVIESQLSTFYHLYHLQEQYGVYWGYHIEQLESVKINQEGQIVKVIPFEAVSYTPKEYIFIRWVNPNECNFRSDF